MSDKWLVGSVNLESVKACSDPVGSSEPSTQHLQHLAELLRQAKKGGIELKCGPCESYLCSVRFAITPLGHIDAETFSIVSDWWRHNFPNRGNCVVRALGTKTLTVDCPHRPYSPKVVGKLICLLIGYFVLLSAGGYYLLYEFILPSLAICKQQQQALPYAWLICWISQIEYT